MGRLTNSSEAASLLAQTNRIEKITRLRYWAIFLAVIHSPEGRTGGSLVFLAFGSRCKIDFLDAEIFKLALS